MMVDFLHIFPEGVGSGVHVYTNIRKLFTIEQFNDKILIFSTAEVDNAVTHPLDFMLSMS